MNWIAIWIEQRRLRALKRQIARMKNAAKAAEAEPEPLTPRIETLYNRLRKEKIVILEKTVERIEAKRKTHPPGESNF